VRYYTDSRGTKVGAVVKSLASFSALARVKIGCGCEANITTADLDVVRVKAG
jgi:hypothetical protein